MNIVRKLRDSSCFDRYAFEILLAIEILMSFTFLGYIHISPISITIAYMPILIAGSLFGPIQSTIAGFVFGAASLYKASASYVLPADMIFSPFLSGSPLNSLILSIGTRTLFGLLIGLAFTWVKKRKHFHIGFGVIAAIAPKLHAFLVYGAMGFLFPEFGYDAVTALHFSWNDVLFSIACILAVELVWFIYHQDLIQNIKISIDQQRYHRYESKKMNLFFGIFELFILSMEIFAAIYFSQRGDKEIKI